MKTSKLCFLVPKPKKLQVKQEDKVNGNLEDKSDCIIEESASPGRPTVKGSVNDVINDKYKPKSNVINPKPSTVNIDAFKDFRLGNYKKYIVVKF